MEQIEKVTQCVIPHCVTFYILRITAILFSLS